MGFKTKLDFSNNRQVNQRIETITVLSGGTSFGVPFNMLPTGPNPDFSAITQTISYIYGTFSGNNSVTVYTWGDNILSLGESNLLPITPLNSGTSQSTGVVFTPDLSSSLVIDGNTSYTRYTGINYTISVTGMTDLGGGNYSGGVSTAPVFVLSASSLDFTGRTIWNDVSGITRTQELIISKNPQIGNILTCLDAEGKVGWVSASASTSGATFWSASTGPNAIVVKNSNSLASGTLALAEGGATTAIGNYSHAQGYGSRAIGNYTHAEGYTSRAIGHTSHAEGTNTTSGFKSFTLSGSGSGLVVLDSSYGNVVSDFTVNSYLLDTGFNDISQISGITYDGFNTKIQLYNTGVTIYGSSVVDISNLNSNNADVILNTDSHSEGQATTAVGIDSSHAEGSYTIAIGNYGSHAEGRETTAIGQTSHAEGRGTTSSGLESHAEGRETTAIGHASHAEGYFTTASGDYSHAEGYYSAAMAVGSHAEGGNPYYFPTGSGKGGLAINIASHAEGMLTTAEGIYSHAEGWGTIANGIASHTQGKDTRASGTSSHASGDNTIADGYCSFVHGNNSLAQGSTTIVLGSNITGTSNNTTYVASLNIKTVGSSAFANDIRIDANGNLTTNTSDERLKENIKPITNALNTIKQLNGINYQWVDRKAGGDDIKLGFIAQQVEIVEPKLVFTNKVDGYKGLHVDGIIPLLVEAVKELSTGVTQTNNSYIETQTILAEDNNVELNYNGTPETALGGGLRVLHAKGQDLSADLITDENGDFVTNNDFKPNTLTIPFFTPTSSNDENGKIGNITRDDNYLYVKTSSGWRRSNLESF